MASTVSLALHYGLRLDASPDFVQGYADGMRLDQRGQGVACGKGWIPRSKKCSSDKARQTSKEAKAKTVEKSRERARLKGAVKAAKGQKPYVKPAQQQSSPKKKTSKPRTPRPLTNEKILSQVLEKSKKMKGQIQEITIPLHSTRGKESKAVGQAEVFGDFALHRPINLHQEQKTKLGDFDASIGGFQITHIPTGVAVTHGDTKRDVKAAMYMLQTIGAGDRLKAPAKDEGTDLSELDLARKRAMEAMSDRQFRNAMSSIADVGRKGTTVQELSTVLPRKLPTF